MLSLTLVVVTYEYAHVSSKSCLKSAFVLALVFVLISVSSVLTGSQQCYGLLLPILNLHVWPGDPLSGAAIRLTEAVSMLSL